MNLRATKCPQELLCHACKTFFEIKQSENESNAALCDRFMNMTDAVTNYGGEVGNDKTSLDGSDMH